MGSRAFFLSFGVGFGFDLVRAGREDGSEGARERYQMTVCTAG